MIWPTPVATKVRLLILTCIIYLKEHKVRVYLNSFSSKSKYMECFRRVVVDFQNEREFAHFKSATLIFQQNGKTCGIFW